MTSLISHLIRLAAPASLSFLLASALLAPLFFAPPAHGADKITYNDQVLPIFRNACLNCHNPDKKKAGLDLSTYQTSLQGSDNGKVLESGNPSASLLIKCVKQLEDPKMPPKGDKLTDGDIALIEKWIAGQLLETANGKAVAAGNNVQLAVVSLDRPDGPPPMPGDLSLDPVVHTKTNNALVALAASPWAPLVAVGGQKQVILYDTATLDSLGILPFPEGFPSVIRFSRNGQLLLTGGGLGGKSGQVVLWNVQTGDRVGVVGNEFDQVLAADISPDQAHVALGGPTRLLKIYATKDGRLEFSLKKHTDWVTAVAFSPDGKFVASADRSGGIVVWEVATGSEFNSLPGHKAAVTALAFMPGILASASEDGTIVLWDVKEAKEIRKWTAHNGGVEWVDFTPDGRLVSCGRDKLAKAWDQTGKVILTSGPFGDIALRAVMSNERVVAGDWSGRIDVFSVADSKKVGELTANPPALAEQLAAAEKRLADAQAALSPLEKAATDATAAIAPAPVAPAAPPVATPPVASAEAQKKFDELTAEIARRREARAKLKEGTPEYAAADAQVQELKPRLEEARVKLATGSPAPVPAPAVASAAAAAPGAPPPNAALNAARAAVEGAQASAARWRRAEAYMAVHKSKQGVAELQARFDQLSADAKSALAPVEQALGEIAAHEKSVAAAPETIKHLEADAAAAQTVSAAAQKLAADAQEGLKAKEALRKTAPQAPPKPDSQGVELPKKLEQQTADMAKLREERAKQKEGTPEYAAANEKVQAMKAEIVTTQASIDGMKPNTPAPADPAVPTEADIAKLRGESDKAVATAKAAEAKVIESGKALDQARKASDAAAAKLAELKKNTPSILASAQVAKAKAETDAAQAAKQLQAAKAQADEIRASYDSRFPTAPKVKSADAAGKSAAKS